ncbi:diguanylate cyclase [Shewanella cyperi]|uniref:diguanylate cyclase n=1 Tax=Shewanella cyperi TaxID=2814292 RepID=A0A974XLJ5_9GAMM|nr:sensor domain-containing diguanylate cyclase [Shewanella cyperi]QSX30621.1 diguanylate cyclase [Shewanella cyperi]
MFSTEQQQAIFQALPDPVFILTRSGRYADILGGSDSRYYHDGSMLIGQKIEDVLIPEKADWFMLQIERALASRQLLVVEYGLAGSDVKGLGNDGPDTVIWFEGRIQALDFTIDGEDAVVWVASNISARHELEAQLRHKSEIDELTGLHNRRSLMVQLRNQFSLFQRYQTQTAILLFDLDFLKTINDSCGHLMGDRVLRLIADCCRKHLREQDFSARYGGDEFVILMPQTSVEQAEHLAQRLRLAIVSAMGSQPLHSRNNPNDAIKERGISGGLSQFSAGDASFEDVIGRADRLLYMAKQQGRNRICV